MKAKLLGKIAWTSFLTGASIGSIGIIWLQMGIIEMVISIGAILIIFGAALGIVSSVKSEMEQEQLTK